MSLKIKIPNSFTVCLISGDTEISSLQEKSLDNLKKKYKVNFCKRSDYNKYQYASFSQIINELVTESVDEFLFFVNPKVNLQENLIEDMLIDLCSGYCWTSRFAFGLWGTTKELFRNIGLMDERFIGGEMEDFDFICRLNLFGKAVNWQCINGIYKNEFSRIGDLRGSSHTLFYNKWIESDNVLYLDEDYLDCKILKGPNKNYISNSWLDYDNSFFEPNPSNNSFIWRNWFFKEILVKKFDKEFIHTNSKILIESNSSDEVGLEFFCNSKTNLNIFILTDDEYLVYSSKIKSNTWQKFPINNSSIVDMTDFFEIKIFHEGSKIYHNKFVTLPIDINIELGLKITNIK